MKLFFISGALCPELRVPEVDASVICQSEAPIATNAMRMTHGIFSSANEMKTPNNHPKKCSPTNHHHYIHPFFVKGMIEMIPFFWSEKKLLVDLRMECDKR